MTKQQSAETPTGVVQVGTLGLMMAANNINRRSNMTTKTAWIDTLASDTLLAYVPNVTPEGEGVLITEYNGRWSVESGGQYDNRADAENEAKAIAERIWGTDPKPTWTSVTA